MAEKHGIEFVEQDQPREQASKLNRIVRWILTSPIFDTLRVGDGTKIANDGTVTGATIGAAQVELDEISTATYDDVHDWFNLTQSAGLMTGGAFTDPGDGTLSVGAGTGYVKTTDSETGATVAFDWTADAAVVLTNNATNTIYVDYNGGIPRILATTTPTATIDDTTQFAIGRVYCDDTTLHLAEAGTRIYDLGLRAHHALFDIHGIVRTSGLITAATGTRQFTVTAGNLHFGINHVDTDAFNSTTTNFTYWYNDGAWQSSATGTISNTHYNDYGTGLEALNPSRYGIHWVFMHWDGHVDVVYGVAEYKLAEAEAASVPANLPGIVNGFSGIIAKIIILQGAASFAAIETPFVTVFTHTLVGDHNDLGSLQGGTTDEYYHLTAAEEGYLSGQDQAVKTDSSVTFADVTASGTETSELIDIDRTIDANVTKGAVQVTEARSGIHAAGGYGGFNYTGTINSSFIDAHAGFAATIEHTAGTLIGGVGAFVGRVGLDGESVPTFPAYPTALQGALASNSASARYGAYTSAVNLGTGDAIGYYGYGYNTSSGDGYGLRGYSSSSSGLAFGVYGSTTGGTAVKKFAFGGVGHIWTGTGNLFVRTSQAPVEVTATGHIAVDAFGCAYIENILEVDGAAYLDGGLGVTGNIAVSGTVDGRDVAADGAVLDTAVLDSDYVTIPFLIDGGGSAISTGIAGWVKVDFAATITGCWLLADQSGAIKVDIWKDTYANYPPDNGDTITGANEPEIAASGVKDEDTTLTSWTTAITAGDILYFNVDSVTTIERCLVSLRVTRA